MAASAAGYLLWALWLEGRVRAVVIEEIAEVRISVAAVAMGLGLPDSLANVVRSRYGYGPAPGP